jgi:sterol desaturase/sphingolipid hydroxylase (fatty acid hydroxylase superfamily)
MSDSNCAAVLPRSLSIGVFGVCLSAIGALTFWPYLMAMLQELCATTGWVPDHRCAKAPRRALGFLATLSAFPAILMIERLWPASRAQKRFSSGMLVDFLWFCLAPLLLVLFVVPVDELLRWLYRTQLGFDSLLALSGLPVVAQITVAILLSDFVQWLAHVVRHKSSFVWEFHKIHHAQEELNYFSAARLHPDDVLATTLVRFLPFSLLDASVAVPSFIAFRVLVQIYAMYTHSNIRTNLGPLKYILVTPQSHRIHHSDLPEHRDRNFGNLFSIWDFLFGTQCLDFDAYPQTGTSDRNVPKPARGSLSAAFAAVGGMLVYPFTSLLQRRRLQREGLDG